MANWAAWFGGSGKVIMVGEYGTVEMKRAKYWQGDISDEQKARTYAACVAQWYAMGVQGIFCWAWQGGIGRDKETGELNQGAQELPKWAQAFRNSKRALGQARIAVVCARKRRSQYGSRKNLWGISDALLGAGLVPFTAIFPSQIEADERILARFDAVLVLTEDLPEGCIATIRETVPKALWLTESLEALPAAISHIAERVPAVSGAPGVIVAEAPMSVTLFVRQSSRFSGKIRFRMPRASGKGVLLDETGETVWQGDAEQLSRDGISLDLPPWECRTLSWRSSD